MVSRAVGYSSPIKYSITKLVMDQVMTGVPRNYHSDGYGGG